MVTKIEPQPTWLFYGRKFSPTPAQPRANSSISLASNVLFASFWYLVHILDTPGLLERARAEIDRSSMLNIAELTSNSLLQSIHAETLRLHVAILLTRTVKKDHYAGSWLLPKGQNITVSSDVEHFHSQWDHPEHPATEFWAERFLDEDGKYTLEGRTGQWIPFGLGEHLCPGRHFAKQEMIINFAVLTNMFDIELTVKGKDGEGWKPQQTYERYGFGTQRPKENVGCKIRERNASQR